MASIRAWLEVAVLRFRWWLARRRVRAQLRYGDDPSKMVAAADETDRYKLQIQQIITERLATKAMNLGLDPTAG